MDTTYTLRARVIEGSIPMPQTGGEPRYKVLTTDNFEIIATYNEENFRKLYEIGKNAWEQGTLSKYEILAWAGGANNHNGNRFLWSFRPDLYNFEQVPERVKEALKAPEPHALSADWQAYYKRFWKPLRFGFSLSAYEDMTPGSPLRAGKELNGRQEISSKTLSNDDVVNYLKGHGYPEPEREQVSWFFEPCADQEQRQECVHNNYDLVDADRWFHLQKVLGTNISFETAMKIDRALWAEDIETLEISEAKELFHTPSEVLKQSLLLSLDRGSARPENEDLVLFPDGEDLRKLTKLCFPGKEGSRQFQPKLDERILSASRKAGDQSAKTKTIKPELTR